MNNTSNDVNVYDVMNSMVYHVTGKMRPIVTGLRMKLSRNEKSYGW